MRPLVPAVLELRCAGAGLLGAGALAAALAVPAAGAGGARAAGLGLAGALAALWLLGGARAAARAARLALPAAGPVAVEPAPRTTARALALAVLPGVGAGLAGALALRGWAPLAPAYAAGALCGAGGAALLCAARIRRAERARGRRLLREPGSPPLGRRALRLEPEPDAPRPATRPPAPWPGHRPPPRAPVAAIEIEPANGSARHARGVRYPRGGAAAQGCDRR